MLDQSKPQQPTPVFISRSVIPSTPQVKDDIYNVASPSGSSARQTVSSVGSIPDFPIPFTASSSTPARKSTNLGPPPSSRRGASSFYSSASFVSPIPEESPRSRSHGSYASSAAMPDTWQNGSPELGSPGDGDAFYEESITEKSRESGYDDFGDESQLVRSASLGKKGKPALVTTKSASGLGSNAMKEPLAPTIEDLTNPATSSPETVSIIQKPRASFINAANRESFSTDAILQSHNTANSSNPRDSMQLEDVPRQQSRLSAIRRPPRLDIDAVRAAESRGSLTSLPDLIRRATRLAAMIDKGKRPASRLDAMEGYLHEKDDAHRSGLSDMLAAFPPPVHTPRNNPGRNSWIRNGAWPTVIGQDRRTHSRSPSGQIEAKPQRRCCGLPLWLVAVLIFLLLCLIVAAIVVPLEFFVFKNIGNKDNAQLTVSRCQEILTCLNGGTSVISQSNCACICSNGFTGSTCGDGSSTGCTMTNLVSSDGKSSIQNATMGRAIPRLLADGLRNFSIPLSGTSVLARVNSGNLSCIAQNSLVTFDGRSTRSGQAADIVQNLGLKQAHVMNSEVFPVITVITFLPISTLTVTATPPMISHIAATSPSVTKSSVPETTRMTTSPTSMAKSTLTSIFSSNPPSFSKSTTSTRDAAPPSLFSVTEEVLDYARVTILFILQKQGVDRAISSQAVLQRLFTKATGGSNQSGGQVTKQEASDVNLGNGFSVNLVDFSLDHHE
ncbi:Epidermal growth factor-like, type 3 [Metarhizium rileyi]|uniref:Epidermal growth factor-like, type 3 n=1 Tax=Metarhizium rileyi (strain RCEF 4871) TaxID=1649241 RepID=A0A167I2C7_METRR|nr:Epidermal growth factor-like, type 3 [Metarhizium rileyi RCEF 4871]